MKKKIINAILLIIVTILVLYFSLKDDYTTVIDTILNIDKKFLLLGFFLLFSYWFFKAITMWIVTKKYGKYRFRNAFRMVVETNFFHAITPFSTGGQPYEIYSLKKNNIKLTDATNVSVQSFIIYQIALVLLGTIAIISNYFLNLFPKNNLLEKLVTLGFIINFLVIVVLFLLSFTKKISKLILSFIVKILNKFKIFKNKDKTLEDLDKYIKEFNEGAKKIFENKPQFFGLIFLQFISLTSLYLIPFVLFMGVGIYINPLIAIATSAYVMLIGSFVPIPGGTGGLEYGFVAFFSNFDSTKIVTAIMLLWRFITYYFAMILGAITLSIGKGAKK